MTTREADKIIKAGQPVTVFTEHFRETFTTTFVSRDRYSIRDDRGHVYDRADLRILDDKVT